MTGKKITRPDVVLGLLNIFTAPAYLEVGVSSGATFHSAVAARKVAVDPKFKFDLEEARKANPTAEYHQVTSDTYFGTIAAPEERFDLIFLDGLHTFEQILRDLLNALHHLKPGGLILVDDVLPDSYIASLSNHRDASTLIKRMNMRRSWMGDTYRLVFFVDSFLQQLSFRTISDNHGQMVLWRQRRPTIQQRKVEDVSRMPYERTILERDVFKPMRFDSILEELRALAR